MKLWKDAVTWYLGGMLYVGLELLWRGWSHGSMFVVGGLCFVLLGRLEARFPGAPLLMRSVMGAVIVTAVELASGLVINLVLGLGVWDYSGLPYNFMGQICVSYFFLWIWVSALALWLSGILGKALLRSPASGPL